MDPCRRNPRPSPPRAAAAALVLLAMITTATLSRAGGSAVADRADYRVRVSLEPPLVTVTATAPITDDVLAMDDTRPGGIAVLDSLGWCGLVRALRVSDSKGGSPAAAPDGARGWKLARTGPGTLSFAYEVDYAALARAGWPAPREAAYRDPDDLVLVGRSLFAFTRATGACRVSFELPSGWRASTPWRREGPGDSFLVPSRQDLVENLVVFSRAPREDVSAGDFHLHVHTLGSWREFRPQLRPLLERVARHHVAMMGTPGSRDYVLVFLPQLDQGGESYRSSFALSIDAQPAPGNLATWGNLVAHEMFHLWNGWMLRGADYASSQWFQEGFTEYAANLAIARSGLVDDGWLRDKLAGHAMNARRLTTSLENIGTRKGPPLYSAGALVAFAWDVRLREATHGRRDLGDFFRALVRRTNGGAQAYAWEDLLAALEATAPGDWAAFHETYIRAVGVSPLVPALAAAGQTPVEGPDGIVRIEADPAAPAEARRLWAALVRRR